MNLDDYRHMWDGSQPGWTLLRFSYQTLRLRVSLRPAPALSTMLTLRRLGFLYLKVSEIRSYVADNTSILTPVLPYDEISRLGNELHRIGVACTVEVEDHSYEAPVDPTGAEVRLDPAVEAAVVQQMVAAGIPFEHEIEAS